MSEPRGWTTETIETLKAMWDGGAHTSDIAETIGKTKNAIIGMANRMHLVARKRSPAPKRSIPKVQAEGIIRRTKARQIAKPYISAPELVSPSDRNLSIFDLTPRTCKWPVGDPRSPTFHYCGARKPLDSKSYCEFHFRMAYEPAIRRKKRTDFRLPSLRAVG